MGRPPREIFRRDINNFCDLFGFGAIRYRKMKDLFEPPYQYNKIGEIQSIADPWRCSP